MAGNRFGKKPDENVESQNTGAYKATFDEPVDTGPYKAIDIPPDTKKKSVTSKQNRQQSEPVESSPYKAMDISPDETDRYKPVDISGQSANKSTAPEDIEENDNDVNLAPGTPALDNRSPQGILRNAGYQDPVEIKSGVTGTITYFKYTGNDKDIQDLGSQTGGYVLVKIQGKADPHLSNNDIQQQKLRHANLTYQNECQVTKSMTETQQHQSTRADTAVKSYGNIEFIICRPIYYNKNTFDIEMGKIPERQQAINDKIDIIQDKINDLQKRIDKNTENIQQQEKSIPSNFSPLLGRKTFDKGMDTKYKIQAMKSANNAINDEIKILQAEIKVLESERNQLHLPVVRDAFKNLEQYARELGANSRQDSSAIFDTIFNGMKQAQADLHKDGAVHLDTAPRNFVVTEELKVYLIDLGASQRCDENGKTSNLRFPLEPTFSYNQTALDQSKHGQLDLHTDLFSLKVAMIETLAYYCGANTQHDIEKLQLDGLHTNDYSLSSVAHLRQNSDLVRLENALVNLTKQANHLSNSGDPRGDYALAAIEKYRDYLASVPVAGKTAKETSAQDAASFNACFAKKPEQAEHVSLRH